MEFNYKPPEWNKTGTEPPQELKTQGWLAGYKPPASYFNWFWNMTYKCLVELQNKLSSLATSHSTDVQAINTALGTKAPLNSPALTGVPTAPTAAPNTKTEQVATTAFVDNAIADIDLTPYQQHTEFVQNANLNTLLGDRAYICAGTLLNAPISTTFCVVRAYDTESSNNVVQVVYVPQSNNTVRTFTRSSVNGTVFGAWLEITTTQYVDAKATQLNMLINENKFRSDALAFAMRKAILMLYIETFETTDDIDSTLGNGATAINSYYDASTHTFVKTDTATVTMYTTVRVVTTGNNNVWGMVDWTGSGTVSLAISRDNGANYTDVANDTLVSISSKPAGVSMRARITMSGNVTLKNFAWGCK